MVSGLGGHLEEVDLELGQSGRKEALGRRDHAEGTR